MKAAMLPNKNLPVAVGASPKHRGGGAAGGSPMHGAGAAPAPSAAPAPVEDDEVSDYTDADESISAPTEFLAEFLSAIMGKDYPTALKYCKLILQYEPNNRTARDFYPLIVEKLVQGTIDEARTDSEDSEDASDSSSGGSGSGSLSEDDSSSDLSEDDDEDDEEGDGDGKQGGARRRDHNDNSSVEYGDTDGTTASYSSLEDEEAEPEPGTATTLGLGLGLGLELHLANDNEDAGNGNEVPAEATGATDKLLNKDETGLTRFSDSESPTEPVSQRLITELRGRVVAAGAGAGGGGGRR